VGTFTQVVAGIKNELCLPQDFFLVTQTTIFDRLSGVINLSIRAYLILQVEKIGMLELKLSKLYFLPLVSLTWDNLYCI